MKKLLTHAVLAFIVTTQFAWTPVMAAEPLVVGRSLALTGPLKIYGEAKRDGGDAYIAKINASGGVGGRQIELVTLDDAYLPATTVENLKKISAERRPVAFLGLFGVPTSAAAIPALLELKIPAVGLSTGTDAVRTPFNRYVFPVRAGYADEARKLVSHVKIASITKISVIYMDNPFGISLKDALITALKDAGLTAKVFKVDVPGKEAASAAALATADAPQAVFLATLAAVGVPVFTEVKKTAFRGAVYGFSPLDATAVTKMVGAKAQGLGISQVFPIPSGSRLKIVAEYLQAVKDLGRGAPSFYGIEAYVEAKVLVEGLRRAGPQPSPASVVKALETLTDLDVGGFFVSYTPEAHSGSNFVEIDVINSVGDIAR